MTTPKTNPITGRKNRPSFKRIDEPLPMMLTERDKQIVLAVYLRRALNSQQIEMAFFPPDPIKGRTRTTICGQRLQKLFHNEYLDRIPFPPPEGLGRLPKVYLIDTKGIPVVASILGIDTDSITWKPQYNQLSREKVAHLEEISSVWTMIASLARDGHFKLLNWIDDWRLDSDEYKNKVPSLQISEKKKEKKRPDGYFALQHPQISQPAHFFLEIDRATMGNARWKNKIKAYQAFRESGKSQEYFGTRNFRVLTVTTSPTRLKNLKKTTEDAGGGRHYWFTTQNEIDIWHPGRVLEPIWQVAGDTQKHALFE